MYNATKEKAREAVLMRLEGKTYREIGEKLGCTREYADELIKTAIGCRTRLGIRTNIIYPRIHEAIIEGKANIYDLSKAAGVGRQCIKQGLTGKTKISLDTAFKIANAIGMTVDEAFSKEEKEDK